MKVESEEAQHAPTMTSTRRGFLRNLTVGSVAAAAAATVVVPASDAAVPVKKPHPGTRKVFRFSTRNTESCRACQQHHRYMVFRTRKIARKHGAHPGCNCPIRPQWIEKKTFRLLFKVNGVKRDFANLRKP
jgi:hypothetical protein